MAKGSSLGNAGQTSARAGGPAPRAAGPAGVVRPAGPRVRRAPTGGAAPSTGGSNMLRMYADDAPGLKIGPTTVLVLSLLFIGFVVFLHIWGKFRRL